MKKFRRLKRGEPISATWLNSLAGEVERLGKFQVVGADHFSNGEDGVRVVFKPCSDAVLMYTQSGGIPAKTGSVPGSGAANFCALSGTLISTSGNGTAQVYNAYSAAFSGSKTIWCVSWNGHWWAITQEC